MKVNLLLATAALVSLPALAEPAMQITRAGTQAPVAGPVENFTGSVRVDPLFSPLATRRNSGAYVTFEPGARSAWHTHPMGQTLIVTAGVGRIQSAGGPVQEIRAGDVIWTPPGVRHWHGAAPGTGMTHIALQELAEGKSVQWLEKVTDAEYNARGAK